MITLNDIKEAKKRLNIRKKFPPVLIMNLLKVSFQMQFNFNTLNRDLQLLNKIKMGKVYIMSLKVELMLHC